MKCFARLRHIFFGVLTVLAAFFATAPLHAQGGGVFTTLPQTQVIEFVNDVTKRRVLLTNPAEIAGVEGGAAGAGWRRSGLIFTVIEVTDVCRFYAPSVNSHFFTLDSRECALLRTPGSGWNYEGVGFRAAEPIGGNCLRPPGTIGLGQPIYRLYNNRAEFRDTTHRFTHDLEVRQALIGQGWIDEGVAFCALRAGYENPRFQIETKKILPSAECEDESLNLGACVGLNQTVRLPYLLQAAAQTPPFVVSLDGSPPPMPRLPRFVLLPEGDIFTSVDSVALAQITEHSFVQLPRLGSNFPAHGIYVNSRDRTTPPSFPYMSINPLYQFVTSPPKDNEPDRRIMPWRDGIVRTLELSFNLEVSYVRRADEGSHAISHPTLELIDTRSRTNLYITLGGAQTVPLPRNEAEDYFAADFGSGKVIVSTSFRANPSFGERIRGDSFFCDATANSHRCDGLAVKSFAFRLRPADIAFVIAKARKLQPLLSPNIADYAIDNFSFNNEVLNNAELAVALSFYTLEIKEQQY